MDDRPQIACCLFATDDEIETDAQEFDCQSCAAADALDGLWPENRHAWTLYRRIVSRFTYDTHSIGALIVRAMDGLEPEDAFDLVERLSVIYQELVPPPKTEA